MHKEGIKESISEKDWQLWVLLHQASDAIAKVRDMELSRCGVTLMHMAVIKVMKQIGEPATAAQIARWLIREHNTVTALLNRMEKQGLVTYEEPDMNRFKRKLFIVTQKGEQAYRQSRNSEVITKTFSILNERKKDILRPQLQELRAKAIMEFASFQIRKQFPFP